MNPAFDDNGQPVLSVAPEYPGDEMIDETADAGRSSQEAVSRLLDRLIGNDPDPLAIGRKTLLLAALLKRMRQRDVAIALGVSEAAVSRAVKSFRENFLGNIDDPEDRG